MASKVIKPQPTRYENVQVNGAATGGGGARGGGEGGTSDKMSQQKPHPLNSYLSDPALKASDRVGDGVATGSADSASKATTPTSSTGTRVPTESAKTEQAVREAKYKLLIPVVPEKVAGECAQCKELSQLLALWELGVGGIARNCSKILAQLNQAREAHQGLEFRLQEKASQEENASHYTTPSVTKSLNVTRAQKAAFRKSVHVDQVLPSSNGSSSGGGGNSYVTENMYPRKETSPGVPNSCSTECVSLPYEHYLGVLNTHLGQAIDLCQQLAAACFKSNYSVSPNTANDTPRLRRQPTAPAIKSSTHSSKSSSTNLTSFRPPLQALPEDRPTNLHRLSNFARTTSSPGLYPLEEGDLKSAGSESDLQNPSRENQRIAKRMVSSNDLEDDWVKVDENGTTIPEKVETVVSKVEEDSKSETSSLTSRSPYHNPVLSVLGETERRQLAKEAKKSERDELTELVLSSSSCTSDNVRDSILSTYSDSDVKQVMSKIAGLEEERIKLLDTIDKLHKDNQLVRLSLGEILGDLQSKDLQLSLAMQDLSIATTEISKAAEFRSRLASLEREKEQLTEHLSNLEDESAAVKVSLIRLLQEKSATNKTLALENWRLSQRMRQLSIRKPSKGSSGGSQTAAAGSAASPTGDADNASLNSGFSTFNEDAGLQETYIGFDDSGHFVHKQGFLKKQGAKVKNWKRRLFVLNTDGLAYFKTEQPIQTIPLDKIDKVQVCHGRTVHANMFEVHTQGRVFFLSAPSEDEMQSWVGMLQTLKQYNKVTAQAQLQAQSLAQAQANALLEAENIDSSPPTHRKVVQSDNSELEPVNLPKVHRHKPLTETTSAPMSKYNRLDEDDADLALLSDEPRMMMSVPNSPTSFGDATKIDPRNSSQSDIIASLNLQI